MQVFSLSRKEIEPYNLVSRITVRYILGCFTFKKIFSASLNEFFGSSYMYLYIYICAHTAIVLELYSRQRSRVLATTLCGKVTRVRTYFYRRHLWQVAGLYKGIQVLPQIKRTTMISLKCYCKWNKRIYSGKSIGTH